MSTCNEPAPRAWATWLAALAAIAVPLSLLWDYSWEFTIGVETLGAPPHLATYGAMALAAAVALGMVRFGSRASEGGVRLGWLWAPLGVWVILWGALAFGTAAIFDRWWQVGYGQSAGIWHPPQILKALAFFAVLLGTWWLAAERQAGPGGPWVFAIAGGAVLTMIFVVTLPWSLANRLHGAVPYQIACGTYPVVLVAAALGGRRRCAATATALGYMLMAGAAMWLLPRQAAVPQVGPIFNVRDHLLPPPFPLLLVAPALALDLLLRVFPAQSRQRGRSLEAALAFFFAFAMAQWPFANFLLSPASEGRFFAGGGVNWPPVQPIGADARVSFWPAPGWEFDAKNVGLAIGLAVGASAMGTWVGGRMRARGEVER